MKTTATSNRTATQVSDPASEPTVSWRAHFPSAFEQAAIGMALVTPEGRWIRVNPALCAMVGYSEAELLATDFQSLTHPDDLEKDLEFVGQMLRREIRSFRMEKRYFHKEGRAIWVLLSVSLVFDEKDNPQFFFAQIQDITEHKQAEENLRSSEDSYRGLVELSPDAMLVHCQGTIVFANNASAKLLGAASSKDLLGRRILNFIHPDHREAVEQRIQTHYRDAKRIQQNETKLVRLDGKHTYAGVVASSVVYQGEPGIQVMLRDISERKKAEHKLRESEANLAAAQRIAHLGSFEQDLTPSENLEDNALRWSDEVFRIFGHEPGDIDVSRTNFLRSIHPDDIERIRNYAHAAIRERKSSHAEYRIVLPNGAERIIHSQSDIVCDAETGNPLRLVGIVQDITDRKRTEDALRRSEANFRSLVENSPYAILRTKPDGSILQINPVLVEMLGYGSETEVLALNMAKDVYKYPVERKRVSDQFRNQAYVKDIEVEWKRRDGTAITVRFGRHMVKDSAGNVDYYELMVEDITAQRSLERQLRQAQKMEAVGRLAGGVAHDFNNLLGVIIGYSELLLDEAAGDERLQKHIEQIKKAGDRATSLTRQLLAFSRQQVFQTRVLNLNAIVADMAKMLPRLIGEDIELQTTLDPALGYVKADQGQIEQVIMNLAVNARDAMPDGGKLAIETSNIELLEGYAIQHATLQPGRYVLLIVTDTGEGMDAETQARIFEPFFTTKLQGKGTGLGLATVYGVIKQSGGYIWVYSEPGVGTTFKVYLPRADESMQASRASSVDARVMHGSATIVLVEDEQSLRALTRSFLEQSGYTVLEARDGNEALDIAARHLGSIDLLLTDMVMPGMNGRAVSAHLKRMHSDIKVLYMSGYTGFRHNGMLDAESNILQKPFTRDGLLRKVCEVLAENSDQGRRPV